MSDRLVCQLVQLPARVHEQVRFMATANPQQKRLEADLVPIVCLVDVSEPSQRAELVVHRATQGVEAGREIGEPNPSFSAYLLEQLTGRFDELHGEGFVHTATVRGVCNSVWHRRNPSDGDVESQCFEP